MGQYWILVNLTKGEYVEPRVLKLCEIAHNTEMLRIMVGLLADDSNGKSSSDYDDHPYVGRWAGDSVMFVGDYGRPGRYIEEVAKALGREFTEEDVDMNLYEYISEFGTNITEKARDMVKGMK